MDLGEFDFDLPQALIALRPIRPRGNARMLLWKPGQLEDMRVSQLPQVLKPGDRLVINNTSVIPARLEGTRCRVTSAGDIVHARITVNLDRMISDESWIALARPLKRLKPGDRIEFTDALSAVVTALDDGMCHLAFNATGAELLEKLQVSGTVPLPPYISSRRPVDDHDVVDYQSVFASVPGAVAAPTASLHFDGDLLDALDVRGVESSVVTLHIGAGTFKPVTASEVGQHRMHLENCVVDRVAAEEINRTRARGGRIIPVGTAALRAVECASIDGRTRPWSGATDLFIRPGYGFRAVDGLLTNFHMPKTTLVMLVAALTGIPGFHAMYRHAIDDGYRFLSYGDCNLLLK